MKPSDEDRTAQWPYASLFLFGFFGTGTPEGRRLAWRTTLAIASFAAAALALGIPSVSPGLRLLFALAVPGAVLGIGWAYLMYLRELDELSRAIQLEAFALSYGAVMTLASAAFALSLAAGEAATRAGPGWFFVWLMLAEPLRGVALVYVASKRG